MKKKRKVLDWIDFHAEKYHLIRMESTIDTRIQQKWTKIRKKTK